MVDFEFLDISGSGKNRRKLAAKVCSFVKSQIFPKTQRVFLNVELIQNLSGKEGVLGDCLDEDDREFTVRVDSLQDDTAFIKTLCHELVHVKQYAKNELRQSRSDRMSFKGKPFSTDTDYMKRPHEKEAYELEDVLASQFLQINGE